MECVLDSVPRLGPMTWVSPEEASKAGSANKVLHEIAALDLRFDIIIEEFAIPFRHSLHGIYASHALLRDTISARQLNLLQYGVVVHQEERLVLVPAPPSCADSGACLAASFERVFSKTMHSESGVAEHPLMPEYTFVVYRVPPTPLADSENSAAGGYEALLRLVFRNVAGSNQRDGTSSNMGATPSAQYKLVAVLTSSAVYYGELQRGIQYRNEWRANSVGVRGYNPQQPLMNSSSQHTAAPMANNSVTVPEAVAREVRALSPLSKLCTCLAYVLERFSSEDFVDGMDGDGGAAAAATEMDSVDGGVDHMHRIVKGRDPWNYHYTREGPRLRRRIDVVERTPDLLWSWRDGELDLYDAEVVRADVPSTCLTTIDAYRSTHPPLQLERRRVSCARVLLLPTHRDGATSVVENEVLSFLPRESSVEDGLGAVYANPAAERLRRWVLQGLVCAEMHEVRAVLLEVDPVNLLAPCVELLYEGNEAEVTGSVDARCGVEVARAFSQLRYRRALFLVCQVVMETVERFIRCSGLLWKVTVATKELSGISGTVMYRNGDDTATLAASNPTAAALTNIPFTFWCREILEVLRNGAMALELSSARNTLTFDDDGKVCGGDNINGDLEAAATALTLSRAKTNADGQIIIPEKPGTVVKPKESVALALTLYNSLSEGPAAPLPPRIVANAKAVGVIIGDADMFALFHTLCAAARTKGMLPVASLVDLLLDEWTGGSAKWRRHSPSRLLCPLDACGVPVNRVRVQRFLRPFLDVMRDRPQVGLDRTVAADATAALPNAATAPSLNYAQFSMVMLAIARM